MGHKKDTQIYLDFETKYNWVKLKAKLAREKKIIKHINLDNVRWKMSSAFWTKLEDAAPEVEEIEIEIDGYFRDLPSILCNLKVFENLKILNVFIKLHEMEIEEKKRAILYAANTMKQELPKKLKASVKEILAILDSKDDHEVPENQDWKNIRQKVLVSFEKDADGDPKFVQLGKDYYIDGQNN